MTAGVRKGLLLLILALVALITALITAWISSTSGKGIPVVIRDGGIAFGGTFGLGVGALGTCHLLD
jgi:hypothetical protein